MTNSQNTSYSQSLTNFQPEHIKEFRDSAIDDIAARNNFRSIEIATHTNDSDGDLVVELLNIEFSYTNPGMPSGERSKAIANMIQAGGWIADMHKGKCFKSDLPREKSDGGDIKYESVQGKGNQQLFIPHISVRQGLEIASRLNFKNEYGLTLSDSQISDRDAIDPNFWDWVLTLDKPLQIIITEGAKKACSLISAGYLAIGLNGMWGWGSNVKAVDEEKADKYGNKLDDKGKTDKLIHPDLVPFLKKNVEIVWALDRDENLEDGKDHKKAIDGVKQSKALFKYHCSKLVSKISDTVWEKHKGVDDLIASEGAGVFHQAFNDRSKKKVVPPATGSVKGHNNDGKPKDEDKKDIYKTLSGNLGIPLIANKEGASDSKLVTLTLNLFKLMGNRLKLNLMTYDFEYEGKLIDFDGLKSFVAHKLGYDSSAENCFQAMRTIATKFSYHPVKDYLQSLKGNVEPDFDLLGNIATTFFGNDDLIANRMMAKALIAAVARVLKPGCKVDTLTVLQGEQGTFKSTFLQALTTESWFCDDMGDLESKDEIAKLARYWVIELAEVDYLMGRKEVESFKRFLSTKSDTYRPPYGRANIRHDRTCALFATTNKNEFLKDPTGSRRYWIIKVMTQIDCELVKKHRDTIWANALAAFERGDSWWLDEVEEAGRKMINDEYQDVDSWEEIILAKWKDVTTSKHINRRGDVFEEVTVNNILFLLDIKDKDIHKGHTNRIGAILRGFGFNHTKITKENVQRKAWIRLVNATPATSSKENDSPVSQSVELDGYLGTEDENEDENEGGAEFCPVPKSVPKLSTFDNDNTRTDSKNLTVPKSVPKLSTFDNQPVEPNSDIKVPKNSSTYLSEDFEKNNEIDKNQTTSNPPPSENEF